MDKVKVVETAFKRFDKKTMVCLSRPYTLKHLEASLETSLNKFRLEKLGSSNSLNIYRIFSFILIIINDNLHYLDVAIQRFSLQKVFLEI